MDGDTAAGHELSSAAAQGRGEGCGPHVLVDENAGGVPWFDDRSRFVDVVLPEQTGGRALEDGQVQLAVVVEVCDLHGCDRAVELALHEDEIQDADDAGVHQVDEQRETLRRSSGFRELDHEVVDRACLVQVCAHLSAFRCR